MYIGCSVKSMRYGVSGTCSVGHFITSSCGSGRNGDCGHYIWNQIKCCSIPGWKTLATSCKWLYGDYGEFRSCPTNKVSWISVRFCDDMTLFFYFQHCLDNHWAALVITYHFPKNLQISKSLLFLILSKIVQFCSFFCMTCLKTHDFLFFSPPSF